MADVTAAETSAPARALRPVGGPWYAAAADAVSDWAVLAFAGWTALCYLAELVDAPVEPVLAGAGVLAVVAAYAVARWARAARAAGPPPEVAVRPGRALPIRLGVGVAAALAAGLLMAYGPHRLWWLGWLAALAAVGLAATAGFSRAAAATGGPAWDATRGECVAWWTHLVALGVAVGLGVLSLFVWGRDLDDVYYVNRAVAVADLGHIPTRDVILTNQQLSPVRGTGAPVDTFSVLEGAVGRVTGVHAGSVAYYAFPVVFTILATWALWRLTRSWAPRRALLCFLVTVAYLLYAGNGALSFGNFFFTRMWLGKVAFVSWLVPTMYVYLSRWARRPDRPGAVLIVAAGLAGIGLTVSATYDVAVVMAIGAVPLLVDRRWHALGVPLAALAVPLVIGAIGSRVAPPASGQVSNLGPVWSVHADIFAVGFVAVVGGVALWSAPWLARDRVARLVIAACCVVAVVVLAPHLLQSVRDVIGLGGALRRILWTVPVPVFVGLLAAVAVPAGLVYRLLPVGLAAGLVGGMAATGLPSWSHFSHFEARPTWKVDLAPLRVAHDLLRRYSGPGPVLAPAPYMTSISLLTARTKAVNPRLFYTRIIPQPAAELRHRLLLSQVATHGMAGASPTAVVTALHALDVQLACAPLDYDGTAQAYAAAGYRRTFVVDGLGCYRPADLTK